MLQPFSSACTGPQVTSLGPRHILQVVATLQIAVGILSISTGIWAATDNESYSRYYSFVESWLPAVFIVTGVLLFIVPRNRFKNTLVYWHLLFLFFSFASSIVLIVLVAVRPSHPQQAVNIILASIEVILAVMGGGVYTATLGCRQSKRRSFDEYEDTLADESLLPLSTLPEDRHKPMWGYPAVACCTLNVQYTYNGSVNNYVTSTEERTWDEQPRKKYRLALETI